MIAPLWTVLRAIPVASFVIVALVWMPSRSLSVLISFLIVFPVVYAGGVMSNKFIRPILTKGAGWKVYFSEPAFSADNAAGTAILCALRAQ